MSFRTILILVNLVAVAALAIFIVVRVVSLRRNPKHRDPENLTPFFDDDVLEGAHLERVLGVSLIALVIVLIGMIAYFVAEPFRAEAQDDFFDEKSVERGAVLFANDQSEHYNANFSLQCADCHGVDGGGGTAPTFIASVDPRCAPDQTVNEDLRDEQPYCLPQRVSWAAPNLQLAALRYNKKQIHDIITYGRAGTPMQAWGVASGKGSLNEQSVDDLVEYIWSISTTSDRAKTLANRELRDRVESFEDPDVIAAADEWVEQATAELAEAQAAVDEDGPDAPFGATTENGRATTTGVFLKYAQENFTAATEWRAAVEGSSEGQRLFMNNCARCHTRGWSYFSPTDPMLTSQGTMGGGAFGPNLRGGAVNAQFSPPNGEAQLFAWIAEGAPENEGFGARGISSGRMPHFGAILTSEQICQIMAYERNIENPPASTAGSAQCLPAEGGSS